MSECCGWTRTSYGWMLHGASDGRAWVVNILFDAAKRFAADVMLASAPRDPDVVDVMEAG